RLRAVVGDEHLAVLIRAHGARIDVEIRVELAQANGIAASLEKRPKSRRCEAFAEGGDHAAGNEDVPLHGLAEYTEAGRFEAAISSHPLALRPRLNAWLQAGGLNATGRERDSTSRRPHRNRAAA